MQCIKKWGLRSSVFLAISCVFAPLGHTQLIDAQNDTRQTLSSPDNLKKMRENYAKARKALADNAPKTYKTYRAKLNDYVLVPYLDYNDLIKRLNKRPVKEVNAFLEAHSNSYLSHRLRAQWLLVLSKQKQWPLFVEFYQPDFKSTAIECSFIYARVKMGQLSALKETPRIWVSHKSLPKACDPLFKLWKSKKGLTDDIAWQRYTLALAHGKTSLARYITSLMSPAYQEYAKKMYKVYSYPATIRSKTLYVGSSPQMQDIISFGIRRYAKHNVNDAIRQWLRYESNQLFDSHIAIKTKAELVKRLIRKGHIERATKWIKASPELQSLASLEPLIHKALTQQHWQEVVNYIDLLSPTERSKERWQYWQARALEKLDSSKTTQENVKKIYTKLAQERSFYGFLSADILGAKYNLQHKTPRENAQLRQTLKNMPTIAIAKELWLTGKTLDARQQWRFALTQLPPEHIIMAGDIAKDWGKHNQAIQSMIFAKQWDMLDIRFPLAYQEEINTIASTINMPPTLIFAIARQESAFLENATSRAGARGLMQLMPATAKQTAKKGGIKHTTSDLFTPSHNILLGSFYLKELLTKYNNNTVHATAAYNAGPGRVDKWLKKRPASLPFDIWIETIPFKETRGYVKNVMAYTVIYAYRLGDEKLKIKTQLSEFGLH